MVRRPVSLLTSEDIAVGILVAQHRGWSIVYLITTDSPYLLEEMLVAVDLLIGDELVVHELTREVLVVDLQ